MFIVYQHLQIICQFLLHEGEIKPSSASSHSCPEFKQRIKLLWLNSNNKRQNNETSQPKRYTHSRCECRGHPKNSCFGGQESALPGKAISPLHTSGCYLNFVIMGMWFVFFSILTKDENVLSHKNMIPGTNKIR